MQFTKLTKYTKGYLKPLLFCPVVMIGEVAMEVLIPRLIQSLIDDGIPYGAQTGDISRVLYFGGAMILAALISMAFGMAGARLSAVGTMGFARNLRHGIFERIQTFSFKNIDKFSTASLVTRLTTDVNQTQGVLMMLVRMAFRSPVMFVMATIMAFQMNPSLTVVLAVAIPLLLIAMVVIVKLAFPRFQIMMRKYDAFNANVQENLIGIRVVKAFVRAQFEKKKFGEVADDLTRAQRAAERVVMWNSPLMQILMYGSMVAVLWMGGKQIVGGDMAVGELFAFVTYITQILMSLLMLSFMFVNFVLSKASVARIVEVLEEQPQIVNPENPVEEVADGSLEFKDVFFSYAGDMVNPVLRDINFSIKSGETIGVIGGTGSAKTTLVSLIPRLYEATSGSVRVGGRDVREYDTHALRDKVSMVLQKNVLFSGPIKDNLRWGNPDATDEELTEACKAACADEFIRSFPDGYDTDLGQGGVNVSGGQKQRLCIARALLKKPKILILDDATSAVDTATDAHIRGAMRDIAPDTTKIIIAQRIASVMDADRVIVLDEGRVVDIGTHEELMARSTIYREVYSSQQKGVA